MTRRLTEKAMPATVMVGVAMVLSIDRAESTVDAKKNGIDSASPMRSSAVIMIAARATAPATKSDGMKKSDPRSRSTRAAQRTSMSHGGPPSARCRMPRPMILDPHRLVGGADHPCRFDLMEDER